MSAEHPKGAVNLFLYICTVKMSVADWLGYRLRFLIFSALFVKYIPIGKHTIPRINHPETANKTHAADSSLSNQMA